MNKRKIQINDIKKVALRGRKCKSITTKYEVALSYFKQKDKSTAIFTIHFEPLILDFLDQLTNAELLYKLENELKDELHQIEITEKVFKLGDLGFKFMSKEFPIQELVESISITRDTKTTKISLQVLKNKLMVFFKHLRSIYSQFCFCVGQKTILENNDIRNVYQVFKCEWSKLYDRGRMDNTEKNEKLLCRSLYFIGVLIENNIFLEEYEKHESKKKEDTTADETKSEKKKNVKGITYPVSSTYSFGSNDMLSSFSYGLKSQKSNEEDYSKTVFSEKSEKIVPKDRCRLLEKAEINNLKIKLEVERSIAGNNEQRVEVDLLSNDVENILIEHAFKIQKLKDACERNKFGIGNPYEAYQNCYHQPIYPGYQNYYHPTNVSEDFDAYQMRRNYNFSNLVEVRKTQSRLGGNKYS